MKKIIKKTKEKENNKNKNRQNYYGFIIRISTLETK